MHPCIEGLQALTHEYGKPTHRIYLGDQQLFPGDEGHWEPSEPEPATTLWRYMSFAKFCSMLERRALFFSLVGDMEDRYEGFIYPPPPRGPSDRLQQAERWSVDVLHSIARTALVSCWTESRYESRLMWTTYSSTEGVAIRTTFHDLRESMRSIAELPVMFGQIKYVDYRQSEVPRFDWAPLFHKRMEYRSENEVRAVLPGPRWDADNLPDIPLDPDVDEHRGRYVPVDLEVLIKQVVVPPNAAPWFAEVVQSAVQRSPVTTSVTRSVIELAVGGDGHKHA